LLQIKNISKSFKKFLALSDISFDIPGGKITALIGPNGAGKSTLFNVITGHLKPEKGKVILEDKNIAGLTPHKVSSMGVGRTFQIPSFFPRLTVKENIMAAFIVQSGKHFRFFGSDDKIRIAADALIDKMNLSEFSNIPAASCPYGIAKELEIAMAMATGPKLLLMDEPTAGIPKDEVERIIKRIKELCEDEHITIFFTEHDISFVLSIASKIVVLNEGKVIFEGASQDAILSKNVREIYLGENA